MSAVASLSPALEPSVLGEALTSPPVVAGQCAGPQAGPHKWEVSGPLGWAVWLCVAPASSPVVLFLPEQPVPRPLCCASLVQPGWCDGSVVGVMAPGPIQHLAVLR